MDYKDKSLEEMLCTFRLTDLQKLLASFGYTKYGRKAVLKELASDLVVDRPPNLNFPAFKNKIICIYVGLLDESKHNAILRNMMNRKPKMPSLFNQQPPYRTRQVSQRIQRIQQSHTITQPPQDIKFNQQSYTLTQPLQRNQQSYTITQTPQHYPQSYPLTQPLQRNQQSYTITETPQQNRQSVIMLKSELHSSVLSNNTILGTQTFRSPMFDIKQSNRLTIHSAGHNKDSVFNTINSIQNIEDLTNCFTIKKLPFYPILQTLLYPTKLIGKERCTLRKAPKVMKQATFKINMTVHQVYLFVNNHNGRHGFHYQMQIRIFSVQAGTTELSDLMPLSLGIRVNNKNCLLPPMKKEKPNSKARRLAVPINCTSLLVLNASFENTITVNWVPDDNTYVMGVYFVNQLNAENLIYKLIDSQPMSSESTKNEIIEKMANIDNDLETTSYRVSLICPLSKQRINIPAKSIKCDHLQCFDAVTFILMNEKKQTWTCPSCDKPCSFDDLQIQTYFFNVLVSRELPDSCNEIELLADGKWKIYTKNTNGLNESDTQIIVVLDGDDVDDTEPFEVVSRLNSYEVINPSLVDLTMSNNEFNEPQMQVHQLVSYSDQEIIEVDASPPSSPQPSTSSMFY